MKPARAGFVVAALALAGAAHSQERAIALDQLRSGSTFLSQDLRKMQEDDLANPAMLWAENGAKLWHEPDGRDGRSCASCHQDAATAMRGVAARYPRVDPASGKLLNLEARINRCRTERMSAAPLPYESNELLSLTAHVALQSRGMPIMVAIDGPARAHFEAGRAYYYERHGQMNLSCAHCHEANWDKRLFSEAVTQGQTNAYPAYRLEWQTLGSLDRRLRACLSGIRAEMLPYGSPEYHDLELFLAWRAQGLPVEAPGVRR
jgi:L-cysteine S-thiosulfotransferase